MSLSEADTRAKLIDATLHARDWLEHLMAHLIYSVQVSCYGIDRFLARTLMNCGQVLAG